MASGKGSSWVNLQELCYKAAAGSEQMHQTEHYVKVCLSLSLGGLSWKDAGALWP